MYLKSYLPTVGNAQIVLKIVMVVMILNIIVTVSLVLFSAYQSEWRMIGRPGNKGEDGPQGPRGDALCGDNPDQDYCRADVELNPHLKS